MSPQPELLIVDVDEVPDPWAGYLEARLATARLQVLGRMADLDAAEKDWAALRAERPAGLLYASMLREAHAKAERCRLRLLVAKARVAELQAAARLLPCLPEGNRLLTLQC